MAQQRLSDERLMELTELLAEGMRANRREDYRLSFNAREISYALQELKHRRGLRSRKPGGQAGELTLKLIAMEVGDKIVVEGKHRNDISGARRTARRRIGENARWQSTPLDGLRTQIERLPDGATYHYGLPKNPLVDKLAAMKVGGFLIVDIKGKRLTNMQRMRARQQLNDPNAQWQARIQPDGRTKIVRTA